MMPKQILRQSAYSGAPVMAGDYALQRRVLNGNAHLVWAYPVVAVTEDSVSIMRCADTTIELTREQFEKEWVRVHES